MLQNKVYRLNNKLTLIYDRYICHGKNINNTYQRKIYSTKKKKLPLCKPVTICTTNGYIIDIPGLFYATQNKAT